MSAPEIRLTIPQVVNLMHLANGRPDLSTARYDHDAGCARIGTEAAKCNCSQARAVPSPSAADGEADAQ